MSGRRRSSEQLPEGDAAQGLAIQALRDDGDVGLGAGFAVGRVGHRAKLECPLAVLEDMEELLRLRVADREQCRERLIGSGSQLALEGGGVGRLQHEQVAQDDARHLARARAPSTDRADEVHMVARLHGPYQELVLGSRHLHRAQAALQLGLDPLLAERLEPAQRHLLALVELLGCDQLRDLVRLRDRSRHDVPPGDLDGLQQVPVADLAAGRADRDLSRGHVYRDELLAGLDAVLVIRDVEDRQQRSQDGERHRDPDISNSVTHRGGFSPSLYSGYSTSWTARAPKNGAPPEEAGTPVQTMFMK